MPSKAFMTHCRREAMHAQWRILLDDEFLEAYKHGIVIQCCDGVNRRFYPRIFTYSADYPEKCVVFCSFHHASLIVSECYSLVSILKDSALALGASYHFHVFTTWE